MAVLKGTGHLEGTVIELDPEGTNVGRDGSQHVIIEDSSVSGKHAKIWCESKWLIEDLGSTNKTLLNGAEIDPHEVFELRDGDRISLGHVVLAFDGVSSGTSSGAVAEARAAIEAADKSLVQSRAELAMMREHVKKQDEAIRSRDEALQEWERRMHEVNSSWLSREDLDREIARREAELRAEYQRQVDAAVRRYQEMEQRYVQVQAKVDTLERQVKDKDDQLQNLALRRA